ncbi:MAG TPA: class I SAM-dependent methyltransferase [Patescibacteria group bacterium]|nr:class I SAM-dependent methyltransferase [Patescibacteria group bacterium]
MSISSQPTISNERLAANIAGDALGLPGTIGTHFTNEKFAASALTDLLPQVDATYPEGSIRVVSLCGGEGFYERTVCAALQGTERRPELTVVDLQRASLDRIDESRFPVTPVHGSVTELPFHDAGTNIYGGDEPPTLVLSRAWEHYVEPPTLVAALRETARILRPGELYAPQLTSGDPKTLGALSVAVAAVADKDVAYLSVDQYLTFVDAVQHRDGSPMFAVRDMGQADTQTGRGVLAQATRYLNKKFLTKHHQDAGENFGLFEEEVAKLSVTKANLEADIRSGARTTEEATEMLSTEIRDLKVYELFRDVYVGAVTGYLETLDSPPERGTTLVHGTKGEIVDVQLDIEYPIVFLERQAPGNRGHVGQAVGALASGPSIRHVGPADQSS